MAPWPLWLLLVIRSPGPLWLTGTYGPHGSLASMAPLGDPLPRAYGSQAPMAPMAPWFISLLLVIRSPWPLWLPAPYGPYGSLASRAPLGDLLSHWLLWLPGPYGFYGSHGSICFLLLIRYPGPHGSLALMAPLGDPLPLAPTTPWPLCPRPLASMASMASWPLWLPDRCGPYRSSW